MPSAERLSPLDILGLEREQADRLFDRLEKEVPVSPGLARIGGAPLREAIVFGDSHGDWRSTEAVARRFLDGSEPRCLVGLGDYIDRAPEDCGEGSVANALYLLELAAEFPDRVFLIQGNHETFRRFPVLPHDLPEEIDLLWGPEEGRYQRLLLLLERGPLAAVTESGAYLAHGGFPSSPGKGAVSGDFQTVDDERLSEIVWGECTESPYHRVPVRPFDERDLDRFLARSGTRVFLRGHDPGLIGRPIYGRRCLTLHTSRTYERYGGVLVARVPLDRPVASTDDIRIEHVETEGRTFSAPE